MKKEQGKDKPGGAQAGGDKFRLNTDFDSAMRKLITTPKPKTGGKAGKK